MEQNSKTTKRQVVQSRLMQDSRNDVNISSWNYAHYFLHLKVLDKSHKNRELF